MAIPYQKILKEDLDLGYGTAEVHMPGGGTAIGNKINPATFIDSYTTLEIAALTPYTKQLVFDTDKKILVFYTGSAWVEIAHGVL